jgi:hypothetical protein
MSAFGWCLAISAVIHVARNILYPTTMIVGLQRRNYGGLAFYFAVSVLGTAAILYVFYSLAAWIF